MIHRRRRLGGCSWGSPSARQGRDWRFGSGRCSSLLARNSCFCSIVSTSCCGPPPVTSGRTALLPHYRSGRRSELVRRVTETRRNGVAFIYPSVVFGGGS